MNLRNELQNIISGISDQTGKNLIQAASDYLRKSKEASRNVKANELHTKEHEAEELKRWINSRDLWFREHDEARYIARGAEQRVYLHSDERHVYKLNDTIFYSYWIDYYHSLLLHNYFFPSTQYELIGFLEEQNILYAVVKQPFIEITEPTDILLTRFFLESNGFLLKKNNDYFNPELGLILEDLHDENVLSNQGVLFFIDTIFYIMKDGG
jgi:hypothetical protein